MTTLISLDTSTKSTGVAIYYDGKLGATLLLTSDIKDADERMKDMVLQIYDLFDDYKPDIVVIETPSVTRNPNVQRELTKLWGAVYGECIKSKIHWCSYRPTEWRKWFKDDKPMPRKRIELKAWAIQKVKELFDIDVNDDIADAVLIGGAYIKQFS